MAAAVGGEVKVLGLWLSPFVLRARIALNLKGVGYEFLEETFLEGKSELLLKSNPVYKKIPVLIHDGKPICESMIIVQYIDEVWADVGPAILPPDHFDRATARFWAVYIDDKWEPIIRGVFEGTTKTDTEEEKAEFEGMVQEGLQLLEGVFEKCSKGKGFFGGDTIGYLDIAFGSYLAWLRAVAIMAGIKYLDEAKTPLLVSWADRFCSNAAVKELVPEAEKLVEVYKSIEERFQAILKERKGLDR